MKLWLKFTLYIGSLIAMLIGCTFLMIVRSNLYTDAYQNILCNVYVLNEASDELAMTRAELENYLTTKKMTSNEGLNRRLGQLYRSINSMPSKFSTQEEQFAYHNIRGMLITLNLKIDDCLKASRKRDPQAANLAFEETDKVRYMMDATMDYLVLKYTSTSRELYDFIQKDRVRSQRLMLLVIICMILFSFTSTVTFVKRFTGSLEKLSETVTEFANAPETVPMVTPVSNDEIGILADAFRIMAADIQKYIIQVNEKMQIETELKNTELKMLQSQINPHFLFNTLNCIAQNAMMEEADETYKLILNMSGMLRYNLRKLDVPVTIGEEIDNLKKYIYIQNARYGEKIEFCVNDMEEELLNLLIPCLTFQPIVENSIIHGFGSVKKKGRIRIAGKLEDSTACVVIEDNGSGMEEEILEKIRRKGEEAGELRGHSTGIGIKNVIARLQLFYNRDVFQIESKKGEGTVITLEIPYELRDKGGK